MPETAQHLAVAQQRGSGRHGRDPEPRYLAIGHIIGVHGVRGELRVEILTDLPERFSFLDRVYIGLEDEEPIGRSLLGYRLHHGRALLRIEGCEDRSTAELLRGYLVQVAREQALPLDDGEYFEHEILGLEVWTQPGEYLGTVVEIIYTGANEVYVVRNDNRPGWEVLIPAIKDVVMEVDLETGRLIVQLPEGLV